MNWPCPASSPIFCMDDTGLIPQGVSLTLHDHASLEPLPRLQNLRFPLHRPSAETVVHSVLQEKHSALFLLHVRASIVSACVHQTAISLW